MLVSPLPQVPGPHSCRCTRTERSRGGKSWNSQDCCPLRGCECHNRQSQQQAMRATCSLQIGKDAGHCKAVRTSSSPPHSSSFLLSPGIPGGAVGGGSSGWASAACRRAAAPSFMPPLGPERALDRRAGRSAAEEGADGWGPPSTDPPELRRCAGGLRDMLAALRGTTQSPCTLQAFQHLQKPGRLRAMPDCTNYGFRSCDGHRTA